MTAPRSRRKSFTHDDRLLEIRIVFDDAEWTTWVYEGDRRLAAVSSVELETVEDGLSRGQDVIGELIEASVSDVLSGEVELPPRQ